MEYKCARKRGLLYGGITHEFNAIVPVQKKDIDCLKKYGKIKEVREKKASTKKDK